MLNTRHPTHLAVLCHLDGDPGTGGKHAQLSRIRRCVKLTWTDGETEQDAHLEEVNNAMPLIVDAPLNDGVVHELAFGSDASPRNEGSDLDALLVWQEFARDEDVFFSTGHGNENRNSACSCSWIH